MPNELLNRRMQTDSFMAEREEVLTQWPTGKQVSLEEGYATHEALPADKQFATALRRGDESGRVLLQPRAGVALVDDLISLLQGLEKECDLLPTTIDSYTRHNRYREAQEGIRKSVEAGHSLLNGFPAVNHGVEACRRIVQSVQKPVQIRHGTPDARLLAEITMCAGFSAFEGGGISYNIPYTKNVPLEVSLRNWQYVDRLIGLYEDAGIRINREPFGPLSGTLVPPCISHAVGIIEGLLALEQGVRSISLGYGQCGNLYQDVAALNTLRELGNDYFKSAGYENYELTTVLHQWMGGFPENEAKATAVISWGAVVAVLGRATKTITKTPHEALGIPTREANIQGLNATRQIIRMLEGQRIAMSQKLNAEVDIIRREVIAIMDRVYSLGEGDLAKGVVRAFESGVLDVPFAPSNATQGKMLPCRDNEGAVRILDAGFLPFDEELLAFHKEKLDERAREEDRPPCFQMVVDDIYAISKGKLVGRP